MGSKKLVFTGGKFVGVGNTGRGSQEIQITEKQSQRTALLVDVDAELVFTAGGAKIGAGYGFNKTNTNTTTIGKSTIVSGMFPVSKLLPIGH